MSKNKNENTNIFDSLGSLTEEEAKAVLLKANDQKQRKENESKIIKNVSTGIVFIQAKDIPDPRQAEYYKDKPSVYALAYTYADKKGNKHITYLCKRQEFWSELIRMVQGSALAKVLTTAFNTTK
jgi:hypothetical protein